MPLSVRAVDRALDILLCFNSDDAAPSMTQIAERAGIPRSTDHRLLATLEARRFLQRDSGKGVYRLGFQLVELASLVLKDMDLPRGAGPHLQRLAAESGETIDLAMLDGGQVVYLQVIESPQRLKIAAAVGQRLPAYCAATGKAFLAFLATEEVQTILAAGLPRHTARTVVNPADLQRDLAATRERGFALSGQEYETDITPVVAPVCSPQETMHDANWLDRGIIAPVKDPVYGELVVAQAQHKMTETPARTKWVCRPVGYDNEHIYLKYMNFGPNRLEDLEQAGVIQARVALGAPRELSKQVVQRASRAPASCPCRFIPSPARTGGPAHTRLDRARTAEPLGLPGNGSGLPRPRAGSWSKHRLQECRHLGRGIRNRRSTLSRAWLIALDPPAW